MGIELSDHRMEHRGHVMPPAGEHRYLRTWTCMAVIVLVMGRSWAPFLAHNASTDLLDGIHGKEAIPRRMVYGFPARWALMLRRQALSILGDAYRWMQEHRAKRTPLPWLVKCELRMLIALGPWMFTNLEIPWLWQLFATDASMEVYGVVSTQVKVAEIQSEARLAETKGWTVCFDDDYNDIEESTWSEPARGYSADTFEESLSSAPSPQKAGTGLPRVSRVAHLFSGHQRHGNLERWLRTLAIETGIRVEVWPTDASIDPTRLHPQRFRGAAEHRLPSRVLSCCSGRATVQHLEPGPPPRREGAQAPAHSRRTVGSNRHRLHGRRESSGPNSSSCASSSPASWRRRAAFSSWSIPGTRDPGGPPSPSIWDLEITKELRSKSGASLTDLDQCMFGQEAQKGAFTMPIRTRRRGTSGDGAATAATP